MNNAADRKSVRKAEKEAALADRARGEVLINLMKTQAGRRFIWDLLEGFGVFLSSYNDEALRMAFNEGRRSAGTQLLADIMHWCPDQYILAMREANGRATESAIKRAAAESGAAGESAGSEEPGREFEDEPGAEARH